MSHFAGSGGLPFCLLSVKNVGDMLACMTTSLDYWPEMDDQSEVARRLRRYMGEMKLSRSRLALMSGIGRTSLASKLDGRVPFDVPEIKAIAHAINKPWGWILTGLDIGDVPPTGPDGSGPNHRLAPSRVTPLFHPRHESAA